MAEWLTIPVPWFWPTKPKIKDARILQTKYFKDPESKNIVRIDIVEKKYIHYTTFKLERLALPFEKEYKGKYVSSLFGERTVSSEKENYELLKRDARFLIDLKSANALWCEEKLLKENKKTVYKKDSEFIKRKFQSLVPLDPKDVPKEVLQTEKAINIY